MKPSTKMLLIQSENRQGNQMHHWPGMPPYRYEENDRHGMEQHPEWRRGSKQREEMGYDAESRFRDRRGREHYDNGRYAPNRSMNYGDGNREQYRRAAAGYQQYDDGGYGTAKDERSGRMNRIGFTDGEDDDEDMDDDPRLINIERERHHGMDKPFNMETAERWVAGMENSDGTKGPHWSLEQVKQVIAQKNLKVDPLQLWAAINAEYSDRQKVNRKYGVDKLDFYIDSAIAFWIEDKDAKGDKLMNYYQYIVK